MSNPREQILKSFVSLVQYVVSPGTWEFPPVVRMGTCVGWRLPLPPVVMIPIELGEGREGLSVVDARALASTLRGNGVGSIGVSGHIGCFGRKLPAESRWDLLRRAGDKVGASCVSMGGSEWVDWQLEGNLYRVGEALWFGTTMSGRSIPWLRQGAITLSLAHLQDTRDGVLTDIGYLDTSVYEFESVTGVSVLQQSAEMSVVEPHNRELPCSYKLVSRLMGSANLQLKLIGRPL